jgi:hypothetical protein
MQTDSQGYRYPAGGDAPDIPVWLQRLAEDAEAHGVSYFTSAADRTAKIAAIPPVAGQLSYLRDLKRYERWNGTGWELVVPRPVTTAQVSSPSAAAFQATLGTFVDFTTGQWPAASCLVPSSGIVEAWIRAHLLNIANATSIIRAGMRFSGAVTRAVDGDEALLVGGGRICAAAPVLLTGLTPGQTLTATPQWEVSAAGASSAVTSFAGGLLLLRPVA